MVRPCRFCGDRHRRADALGRLSADAGRLGRALFAAPCPVAGGTQLTVDVCIAGGAGGPAVRQVWAGPVRQGGAGRNDPLGGCRCARRDDCRRGDRTAFWPGAAGSAAAQCYLR